MSADERVTTLLAVADKAIKGNDLQKAAQALKNASSIQPGNPDIVRRWTALQKDGITSNDSVKLVKEYIDIGQDADADRALKSLRSHSLSPDDAKIILDLLLDTSAKWLRLDEVFSTLILRDGEVRRLLSKKIVETPTSIFQRFWNYGEQAFYAFAALPLDDKIWPSTDARKEAQKGVFQLCIATVIEAGVDHPNRALKALARILAVASENVSPVVDEDVFEVILSFLDIRLESTTRSQATLASAKMLEATGEKGGPMFANFVTAKVAKQTNDDLIIAFSAAATAFPMIPATVSALFLTEGFVQSLVPSLEKNSKAGAAGRRKSTKLEQAALELLSAACIDKACRAAINRYCSIWLSGISEEQDSTNRSLAALVLAKVDALPNAEVTEQLSALVLDGKDDNGHAIEGLAYTSLQPKVKEEIVSNEKLVVSLVKNVEAKLSARFGALTTIANLVTYRIKQNEEQKKINQLKAYANQTPVTPEDPLDNDAHVTMRCKKMVDANVVPALVTCLKEATSLTITTLLVRILLALSKEQKHRSKMIQQGAVRLLLQIRDRLSRIDQAATDAVIIARGASHSIARLLISVNPAHVFSTAVPSSSAVGALIPLLSYDQESEQRDLLPTFEGLLALTNLASMEDQSVHDLILRTGWEKIEDLLFSSNILVQRATVELVCNLMASPTCVAKFADGSADAKRRMTILLALADVEDMATRRASGGALAMLTEWDAAVTAVLDAKDGRGPEIVLDMCSDKSQELQHRGFVCLLNIISAPNDVGKRGIEDIKARHGADVIGNIMISSKDQQLLGLGAKLSQSQTT